VVNLPINSLIGHPPSVVHSELLTGAQELSSDRVAFEDTPEGLRVHGLTEIDLEFAIYELRKRFPQIKQGKPEVAYQWGPPLLERYYRATIEVPVDSVGSVIGDMSLRRGMIETAREEPTAAHLVVEVPVSECFGYDAKPIRVTEQPKHG
jgi:predicted membrane GTPase involved in stress response